MFKRRLNPIQLNSLIASLFSEHLSSVTLSDYQIDRTVDKRKNFRIKQALDADIKLGSEAGYLFKDTGQFILFDCAKDSSRRHMQVGRMIPAPSVEDVIAAYKQKSGGRLPVDKTLLIPIIQCRGYLKGTKRRKHYALCVIHNGQLHLLNSQHPIFDKLYPDKFKDIAKAEGLSYSGSLCYSTQYDNDRCGMFCFTLAKALVTGKISLQQLTDKRHIAGVVSSEEVEANYAKHRGLFEPVQQLSRCELRRLNNASNDYCGVVDDDTAVLESSCGSGDDDFNLEPVLKTADLDRLTHLTHRS
ncbi:hypothetical protein ACGP04_09170 [Piscirickettsia salmonis]|uniref:hypothetical protein n=1 Tax=Piscirickettsia salmonis TaxID=1238 RepID=UPI000F085B43|nr:hypothetical protein DA717_14475 [Piscirickettsiaceae bacterium NZ-RLO2]